MGRWTGPLSAEEAGRRSRESALDCQAADDGLTEQSHVQSSDINFLMARYESTGFLPVVSEEASFGDFTGVRDYQSAMNAIIDADEKFMSLPAGLRKRFENDPSRLIEFLDDGKNRDEAITLGLIDRVVPPDATLKDVVEAVKATKPVVRKKPSE